MSIARTISTLRYQTIGRSFARNFRISSTKHESTQATQPQVQEEKFDFEDLKVLERIERRKPKIPPFMKDIFMSVFNRDLLAYPEILNKDEFESLDERAARIEAVFSDAEKTKENRREVLIRSGMFAAPVSLTNGGLAMNFTEGIRYLESMSADPVLSQELVDHWVSLEALRLGLDTSDYQKLISDLTSGERTIGLCIREKLAERITQADFRTNAKMDGQGVWRISGEKICHHNSGYLLVLSTVEAGRLKALLVHPGAEGVTKNEEYVSFQNTPATPLEHITEPALARALGAGRLYAATLCRLALLRAALFTKEFVGAKVFSGKPLSNLSTVRSVIGEACLNVYASESAEYFTAGLMDGYEDPDAEVEAAMCRNFINASSMDSLHQLLVYPETEQCEEAGALRKEAGALAGGEAPGSLGAYIALNGIQHAGRSMAEEIKAIRNPLFNPAFILKKIVGDRHQEKDDPKLTLYLAEHLHPTLKPPSEQLEYCVLRMRYACETLMARHGVEVAEAHTELQRLAEAATQILVMTAVLSRASRAYCIGLRNADVEMKMAACFVEQTKNKVKKLILEIDDGQFLNLDHFKIQFGQKMLENNTGVVERATARVFW